jgi:hypothetical protein
MSTLETQVRTRRAQTNRLIAVHDALRLKPYLAPEVTVIPAGGSAIRGARAVIEAFAAQFADPAFVTYVRTPDLVEVTPDGQTATESGRWIATWRTEEQSGVYEATWKRRLGHWVIASEWFTRA